MLPRGQQTLKGPDSTYFRLVGDTVSLTATQFCCFSAKAAKDNM